MSEIAKQIDAIIRASLAPLLKSDGFTKKSSTFLAESSDHTKIINVQLSQWNEGSEGSFTLNLGVYFPSVAEAIEWFPIKTYPKEYDCTIRQRIGVLMPDGRDTWWKIAPAVDLRKIKEEVVRAWTDYGKPWLTQVSTLEGAKAELVRTKGYFQATGIALVQREKAEAKDLLLRAIKRQPLAKARLRSWGLKHDLIEDDAQQGGGEERR